MVVNGLRGRIGCVALLVISLAACNSGLSVPTSRATGPAATSSAAEVPNIVSPTPLPARETATSIQTTDSPTAFDGSHAYQEYLLGQMRIGVRSTGTAGARATGDYILAQLASSGVMTSTQEFAYRNVPVRNVIGKLAIGKGPIILLGAHYDTRIRGNMDKLHPDQPVPGADDGASGVAVLLELARVLDPSKLHNEVWLAFFDAEDNGDLSACDLLQGANPNMTNACDLSPWPWSVGSNYVADHLDGKPSAVVILDMIGDANQDIYYEKNSNQELQKQIWTVAAGLGYSKEFIPEAKWSMTDDHTPFLQAGLRAVDIIDFDYPYWHTTQDTTDKVSAASLERVGRVIQAWLEGQ